MIFRPAPILTFAVLVTSACDPGSPTCPECPNKHIAGTLSPSTFGRGARAETMFIASAPMFQPPFDDLAAQELTLTALGPGSRGEVWNWRPEPPTNPVPFSDFKIVDETTATFAVTYPADWPTGSAALEVAVGNGTAGTGISASVPVTVE